jgi:hypothetical protein
MKVAKVLGPIEVISEATKEPQLRRVAILERDDGHFTFAEEYLYTSEYEGEIIAQRWARLWTAGIYDNLDKAEAEGRLFLQRHK